MLKPTQTHPDSYRKKVNMVIPPACRQTDMANKNNNLDV